MWHFYRPLQAPSRARKRLPRKRLPRKRLPRKRLPRKRLPRKAPAAQAPAAQAPLAPLAGAPIAPVAERLRKLSDAELMAAYQQPETVMRAQDAPPANRFFGPESANFEMFGRIRVEIARRGAAMQPLLLAFLRDEISVENHYAPSSRLSGIGTLYRADAMKLLVHISAPNVAAPGVSNVAATALVEILDAPGATDRARSEALEALEQLTLVGFFKARPHSRGIWRVDRVGATPLETNLTRSDAARAATWYRAWLAGEGANPAHWLGLAQQRARAILARDDLDAIYSAVEFLSFSGVTDSSLVGPVPAKRLGRDEAPAQTAARLGEILGETTRGAVKGGYKKLVFHEYLYRGRALPVSVGNWTRLLASYGAYARPYAGALMRLQDQEAMDGDSFFRDLSAIGGKAVVGYCVSWLPRLEARLRELGVANDPSRYAALDLDKMPEDELQSWALFADRNCRYTVDRWAGRTFEDDAGRLRWWQTPKAKRPNRGFGPVYPWALNRPTRATRSRRPSWARRCLNCRMIRAARSGFPARKSSDGNPRPRPCRRFGSSGGSARPRRCVTTRLCTR